MPDKDTQRIPKAAVETTFQAAEKGRGQQTAAAENKKKIDKLDILRSFREPEEIVTAADH